MAWNVLIILFFSNKEQGQHSQLFVFFVTYARVLQNTRLERLAGDKRCSLLGLFICYEEYAQKLHALAALKSYSVTLQ